MSLIKELERRHTEAAEKEKQLAKMVTLVRELGEDGLSELVELLAAEDTATNGNGHGRKAPAQPEKADAPRGREAVRQIVRERPGIWTLTELRAVMVERGWFTSQKGLEAAVNRLCSLNGEGRGLGSGRYVFPDDRTEEVEDESGQDGAATLARIE